MRLLLVLAIGLILFLIQRRVYKKNWLKGLQVDIDKAIKIEERLFGECFENPEQKERKQVSQIL